MKLLRLTLIVLFTFSILTNVYSCKSDDNSSPEVEVCSDGIDNDGDGFTDCEDADCEGDSDCALEICNDGIDNDEDGFTDCDDADCDTSPDC